MTSPAAASLVGKFIRLALPAVKPFAEESLVVVVALRWVEDEVNEPEELPVSGWPERAATALTKSGLGAASSTCQPSDRAACLTTSYRQRHKFTRITFRRNGRRSGAAAAVAFSPMLRGTQLPLHAGKGPRLAHDDRGGAVTEAVTTVSSSNSSSSSSSPSTGTSPSASSWECATSAARTPHCDIT